MKRTEILGTTENIFNKAGFHVSQRCVARRSCFDFAARREGKLTLVKVLVNIGNVSREEASEFQRISKCFSATPLFIGDKTRRKPLEDDTVYMRYNIYAITSKTLGNVVFLKMLPLVEAGPGGCYVNLDENIIKKKRQELGLSVGKLAEMMGVSRRTVYGYERGMTKASVSAAYKLEWILGVQAARPIDVFQTAHQDKGFFSTAMRRIVRNSLLGRVLKKLAHFDFRVTPTKRAPFDFIAQLPEEQLNIIGGVAGKKEPNIDQRTEEIISVGKVINAQSVFITDGKQIPNNISLIHREELMRIKSQEDLMARL